MSPASGSPVVFEGMVAHVLNNRSVAIAASPPGPPERVDGYSIGVVPVDVGPGPHNGEMHPDGDELLHVIAGKMELILDDGDSTTPGTETVHQLVAGEAIVVPRGVWHRVEALEPSTLLHATPGPGGEHRPRPPA